MSLTGVRAASVTDSSGSLPHRIRVLIVDEHAAVRRALAAFLAAFDDLCLAGQAASGAEAMHLCASSEADVVLLDVTPPDMTGAAAIRGILECCPSCRVIATCTFQEEDLVPEALSAGAAGYLLKNVSAEELASTIRAAYAASSPDAHTCSHEQKNRGGQGTRCSQSALRTASGGSHPWRTT